MRYLVVVFAVLCAQKAFATEHVLTKAITDTGETVPVDITLGHNIMLTYPGKPDPPQDCFNATVNLHDFQKKLVAVKVIDKGTCYVKPSTKTYEEVRKLVEDIRKGKSGSVNQATEGWETLKTPLSTDKIAVTVGRKIADFCSGYRVFLVDKTRRDLFKRAAGCCWVCLWCG